MEIPPRQFLRIAGGTAALSALSRTATAEAGPARPSAPAAAEPGFANTRHSKVRMSGSATPRTASAAPPHDGRTHRDQKKKAPFSAAELKEKGPVKV
jgi:hypothetical protein